MQPHCSVDIGTLSFHYMFWVDMRHEYMDLWSIDRYVCKIVYWHIGFINERINCWKINVHTEACEWQGDRVISQKGLMNMPNEQEET